MKILENKIPPPIVALIFAVLMWFLSFIGFASETSGFVLWAMIFTMLIIGLTFAFLGSVSFKKVSTTINPLKPNLASSLVTTGIYEVSRNPMYVGLVFCLMAWGFYLSSFWALLGVAGFILYINQFQIKPEEKALKKIFGDEFVAYQAKVRRWL